MDLDAMRESAAVRVDEDFLTSTMAEVFGDFPTFCSLLRIRLKAKVGELAGGEIPFHFEDWHEEQRAFERERTGLDIVLKARQIGFSTLELARDLWFALTHRGVQVLVVVHDKEISHTLFSVLQLFANCLDEAGLLPTTRYSTRREYVFEESGSAVRIVEAGETEKAARKKGRSGTVHRLHCTEVAFWGAAAETMSSVREAVPEGGEVVIESTPYGVGGVFHDAVVSAQAGRSRYKLHFFPWFRHAEYRLPVPEGFDPAPRDQYEERLREEGCDDEQVAFWRNKVEQQGVEKALREYPCDPETCFRASGATWVEQQVVDKLAALVEPPARKHAIEKLCPAPGYEQVPEATRDRREPPKVLRRFGDALVWREPVPGELYVVFGDVAEGVANDGSSATVMHARSAETVAEWWGDTVEPGDFGYVLEALGLLYNTAMVACERNNHGHTTLRVLIRELAYPNVFRDRDGRPGWNTTPVSRPLLWDDGHHAVRQGALWTPSSETLGELRTVVVDKDGKPRARGKGQRSIDARRDDRVVSWFGAFQVRGYAEARKPPPPGSRDGLQRSSWRSGGGF